MTDSMVERVARAICSNAGEKWNAAHFNETANGEEPEEQRDHWRGIARAAIEAIREPGLAIRKLTTFEFAEIEWPRLIDAALSEEPK
jgi:hypothetical protein